MSSGDERPRHDHTTARTKTTYHQAHTFTDTVAPVLAAWRQQKRNRRARRAQIRHDLATQVRGPAVVVIAEPECK